MASLAGVLPELVVAHDKLQTLWTARGHQPFSIADYGGIRSESDTTRIMKYRDDDYAVYVAECKRKGITPRDKYTWRPIAPFGGSMHNYGAAFDAAVHDGSLSELGALAPQAGLRWGGTFVTRKDFPHFELPITVTAARDRWEALGNAAGEVTGLPAIALMFGNIPENRTQWILGAALAVVCVVAVIIFRRRRHV